MRQGYIVETEDLTKEFKGFVAVSEVNLKVRAGTIHALTRWWFPKVVKCWAASVIP